MENMWIAYKGSYGMWIARILVKSLATTLFIYGFIGGIVRKFFILMCFLRKFEYEHK